MLVNEGGRPSAGRAYLVLNDDAASPGPFDLATLLDLGSTIADIRGQFAGCTNLSNPQGAFTTVLAPPNSIPPGWKCTPLGLTTSPGDTVRLFASGTAGFGIDSPFEGQADGLVTVGNQLATSPSGPSRTPSPRLTT